MAKFFLSHSADDNSTAHTLLKALGHAIRAAGHQSFEASQIRSGEKWRGRIYDELASCDGAIVLMDQTAIASWWVHREVFNLLWRQHLGSVEIRVLPLDGVKPGDLRANGYGELVELQFEGLTDRAPAMIADAVVAGFGAMPEECDDSMRIWIDDVVSQLTGAPVGRSLHRFAEHLGLAKEEIDGLVAPSCYRFLAHQLLNRPTPDQIYLAVSALARTIGSDRTAQLAELSAPVLVEALAARPLIRAGDAVPRIYLLNARHTATAHLYVMRAACCAHTHRIECVSARTGEGGGAELEQRCEAALARALHLRGYTGQRLYAVLATMQPGKGRMVEGCYLAIDLAEADPEPVSEVIRRLQSRVRWLTVIVLTARAAELAKTWSPEEAVLLEPLLTDGEEERMVQVLQAFQYEMGSRTPVGHG